MTALRVPRILFVSTLAALCGLALAPTPAGALSTIVLEAETALLSGPVVSAEHSGFQGTGYVDFGPNLGEFVEWTVTASEAGIYAVTFRYALELATPRQLELTVNGGSPVTVDFPSTGEWFIWKTTEAVEALLAAGPNTVRVTAATTPGPNLDQLRVSVIPDPEDIVGYEAEEAVLVGPAISVQHAGFTGTGYADYGPNLGEYIEWTVDAPVDGFYTIAFRYALAEDPRPLLITLNVANETTVEFPPTNAWTNWELTEPLEVELPAGQNIIRATAANNIGANVDSLILTLLVATEEENFPPTAVTLDENDVPENTPGAEVGNITVIDQNELDEHVLALSDPRFEVIGGVLKLVAGTSLDYETEPTVSLDITATDLAGASVTSTLIIEVLDSASFQFVLEAEDGVYTRAKVADSIPGATGEGYLRFSHKNGAGVEWVANVATAGTYELQFRYTGPLTSAMRLRVNGTIAAAQLQFPRVKDVEWRTWRTVSIEVQLNAGDNTIRLDAIGRRRSFLDSLTIVGE